MRPVIGILTFCLTVFAQSTLAQSVAALPRNVQVLAVPASTPATYLNLTVDESVNGNDFIDVLSPSSQVAISLILPIGTEVTPSNASTFGFSVLQQVNSSGSAITSGVLGSPRLQKSPLTR